MDEGSEREFWNEWMGIADWIILANISRVSCNMVTYVVRQYINEQWDIDSPGLYSH